MFRLIWTAGVNVRDFLQRYMPSNILMRATHRRAGLKWGVPAMLVAGIYLVVAAGLVQWSADGGPGWLNLVVLVCLWNALKCVLNGPVTVVMLVRARAEEAPARRALGCDRSPGGALGVGARFLVHRESGTRPEDGLARRPAMANRLLASCFHNARMVRTRGEKLHHNVGPPRGG